MQSTTRRDRRVFVIGTTAVAALSIAWLASCATPGADAAATLRLASDAMGAGSLKSIRYTADGTGYTFGQAHVPGAAWPKITVHALARSINYETASMREEITLSRAEPKGGGGYPLQGQQRNDQYVSGGMAWNQGGAGPLPGPRFVADRVHQLWITPHGVLKAAQRNNATAASRADGSTALSFTEPGRFSATVVVGADGLVQRVESRAPDAVLGEVDVVTRFGDYKSFGNIKFPGRIEQSAAGFPVLDVTVREVEPDAAVAIVAPEILRNYAERVATEPIAPGVWFVGGGSHNSVVIEMKDHLVLVESPLNDGPARPSSDTFLMVHLPAEKILIEADAYTPLAPNAQPPAVPNANHVNLIANIERLKLPVERIAPLHGRVVPLSELYTTARTTPK